jgi:[protein-PII] uridylyltransferase
VTDALRDGRQRLVADGSLVGSAFGRALSDLVDRHLVDAFTTAASGTEAVLVAMGSYARRELCPASDVDVMLVHDGGKAVAAVADALWYPLWDAGFVTGHATRTVKDALSIADADLAALTSMFGVRVLAGSARLADDLERRIRSLAAKRRRRVVEALADAADRRVVEPGPIAELLEPDLKEGAGGLRDLQSLDWAGWTLEGPTTGLAALVAAGYVQASDPQHLDQARELLLTARVALHRVTGRKGDEVPLQEQDAVAAAVGAPDADVLVRDLAAAARAVSWITGDAWDQLRSAVRGPGSRSATGERPLEPGLLVRDGRAALGRDTPADLRSMLRLAAVAAEHGLALERASVVRLGGHDAIAGPVSWDDEARHDLVRLLLAGPGLVPVVEALDRTGGFGRLVPGWHRVRSLPQRNAYHRYTIDRHLLEAVARCAALLTDPGFDGDVARSLSRPHLLALAALFHDIGKGLPGDHSRVGAEIAGDAVRTVGFGADDAAVVELLVEHHLLLADTATRRDLGEEATVVRVARLLGDPETLSLLYLLTIGDSLATGASAWNASKAALVRELYVKTRHLLEQGEILDGVAVKRRAALREILGVEAADRYLDAFPAAYPLAFDAPTMAWHHALFAPGAVRVEVTADGPEWVVTVAASDRPGMFAGVTGALALHGLDVHGAAAFTRIDGAALESFRVDDPFGRLASSDGARRVADDVRAALDGTLSRADLDGRVLARAARYAGQQRRQAVPRAPEVVFDPEGSDFATIVEVHADDAVGLLARIAATLTDHDLDVRWAKVATIGDRVVDAFSVRTMIGERLTAEEQAKLRTDLLARLSDGAPSR